MSAIQPYVYTECQHVRPNGAKCRAIAIRGHRLCYFHLHVRRQMASIVPAAAVDNESMAPAQEAATLALPVLEDRSAVQIGLSQVLRALAANQIDTKRASLLIYGFQIASKNCTEESIVAPHPVHELTLTPEGEELGPEIEFE
jgi:hypothetical protein